MVALEKSRAQDMSIRYCRFYDDGDNNKYIKTLLQEYKIENNAIPVQGFSLSINCLTAK